MMKPVIMDFGKYRGQNTEWILKNDPQYLDFIYFNAGCGAVLKYWIKEHWDQIEIAIKNREK